MLTLLVFPEQPSLLIPLQQIQCILSGPVAALHSWVMGTLRSPKLLSLQHAAQSSELWALTYAWASEPLLLDSSETITSSNKMCCERQQYHHLKATPFKRPQIYFRFRGCNEILVGRTSPQRLSGILMLSQKFISACTSRSA